MPRLHSVKRVPALAVLLRRAVGKEASRLQRLLSTHVRVLRAVSQSGGEVTWRLRGGGWRLGRRRRRRAAQKAGGGGAAATAGSLGASASQGVGQARRSSGTAAASKQGRQVEVFLSSPGAAARAWAPRRPALAASPSPTGVRRRPPWAAVYSKKRGAASASVHAHASQWGSGRGARGGSGGGGREPSKARLTPALITGSSPGRRM